MQYTRSLSIACLVSLGACSGAGTVPAAGPSAVHPANVAPNHYKISVFVRGNTRWYNPDPIVSQNGSIFVAYQNATQATGSGGKSTIVEYDQHGHVMKSIEVKGRCDGMRWNPYTNLMWITVNEDANSSMFTWDPGSGGVNHYHFSSAKHGGGYDDQAFSNNMAFIAASNPKLDSHGINKGPAVVSVVLQGSTAEVTPVLMGNAQATDIPTGKKVQLNLTDPDSMTVASNGDVLLVSQADEEIVWIHNAGKSSQSVSRLLVGTELDDTVYATQSSGSLYVVDAKNNAVYLVQGKLQSGGLYTEAPSDSGVYGFVGTVNQMTGGIDPVITGFGSPTGLIFVPSGD